MPSITVPPCSRIGCNSRNVLRLNPLGKIPFWHCEKCNHFFIKPDDRIKVEIVIGQDRPELKTIDDEGVINERVFEFWARTDYTGFARRVLVWLREKDPEFFRRNTPCTTIEREYRAPFEGNDEGLNKTWRAIKPIQANERSEKALEHFGNFQT